MRASTTVWISSSKILGKEKTRQHLVAASTGGNKRAPTRVEKELNRYRVQWAQHWQLACMSSLRRQMQRQNKYGTYSGTAG